MWDRIKQTVNLDGNGHIQFGAPAAGFRGVPVADLGATGPWGFTYVLTSSAGDYEVGFYYMEDGSPQTDRQVLESSLPSGFAANAAGLTLVVAPSVRNSPAVSASAPGAMAEPRSRGYNAVALGASADASPGGTVVGSQAYTTGIAPVAVGKNAAANATATAVGSETQAELGGVAIGHGAQAGPHQVRISALGDAVTQFGGSADGSPLADNDSVAVLQDLTNKVTFTSLHGSDKPGIMRIDGIVAAGAVGFDDVDLARVFQVTGLVQVDSTGQRTFLVGPTVTTLFQGTGAADITLVADDVNDELVLSNASGFPIEYRVALQGLGATGTLAELPADNPDEFFLAGGGGGV